MVVASQHGWMDGWMNDYSIAIVDAYIASIAIRIMSDTRDEEKDRNKDERCLIYQYYISLL